MLPLMGDLVVTEYEFESTLCAFERPERTSKDDGPQLTLRNLFLESGHLELKL